jgi:hypothetical protein
MLYEIYLFWERIRMAVLTRADIINGKQNIQTIEFKELDGSLKLRPLTDGELQRVVTDMNMGGLKKMKAQPVMKNGKMDKEATMATLLEEVDLTAAAEQKYEASCLAISLSLDHDEYPDKFTIEDVKAFPAGSVNPVASKVFEISGVDDPDNDRMTRFRGGKPKSSD